MIYIYRSNAEPEIRPNFHGTSLSTHMHFTISNVDIGIHDYSLAVWMSRFDIAEWTTNTDIYIYTDLHWIYIYQWSTEHLPATTRFVAAKKTARRIGRFRSSIARIPGSFSGLPSQLPWMPVSWSPFQRTPCVFGIVEFWEIRTGRCTYRILQVGWL